MKKILEILQYGDTDIRFRTDLKPADKPDTIPGLVSSLAFAMMTTLWGANERDIIPVLRALTIADLAVSVNREEMIRLGGSPLGYLQNVIGLRDAMRDELRDRYLKQA